MKMNMKFNQKWIAAALFLVVVVILFLSMRRDGYDMSDKQKSDIEIVFNKYKLTDEERNTILEAIKPIDSKQGLSLVYYERVSAIFVKYEGLAAEIEPFFKTENRR
jgi:hypothetical protein